MIDSDDYLPAGVLYSKVAHGLASFTQRVTFVYHGHDLALFWELYQEGQLFSIDAGEKRQPTRRPAYVRHIQSETGGARSKLCGRPLTSAANHHNRTDLQS